MNKVKKSLCCIIAIIIVNLMFINNIVLGDLIWDNDNPYLKYYSSNTDTKTTAEPIETTESKDYSAHIILIAGLVVVVLVLGSLIVLKVIRNNKSGEEIEK